MTFKKKDKIIILLFITSLVISIVAICLVLFRMEPITFGIDRYNLSIDVLGILVTILIGYQVINVISFEKRMRSVMEGTKKELSDLIIKKITKLEGDTFISSACVLHETGKFNYSFFYAIQAVEKFLKVDDTQSLNECFMLLDELFEYINEKSDGRMDLASDDIQKIIKMIEGNPNYEKIKYVFEKYKKQRDIIINPPQTNIYQQNTKK